jgi:formylglycine-generating enzyme
MVAPCRVRARRNRFGPLVFVLCVVTTLGCGCDVRRDATKGKASGGTPVDAGTACLSVPSEFAQPPQLLYLPDGGDVAIGSSFVPLPRPDTPASPSPASRRCPDDMVDIAGAFCIDRYEGHLVDKQSQQALSPYYPPESGRAKHLHAHWENQRAVSDNPLGSKLLLPDLPDWQLEGPIEPMAVSAESAVPSGYLDANTAERACKNADKRLCTATEWVTACRGQQNRQFPYGSQYVNGACNIFREAHPAQLLHGNASEGHLDPRLNLVEAEAGPLLRRTGASVRCRSEWGTDAVFDMVGNLDEWVDDAEGAFHGGFYARSTKLGCEARISTHPRQYSDYSLGVRCCR